MGHWIEEGHLMDWKAFLLAYAILCIIYGVARWTGNLFDRWWIKMFEEDNK